MITFNNSSFQYAGDPDAGGVHNINLTIPEGQVVLLCGASGCGKTTLTRMVNGLIPHYYEGDLSGNVTIDGAVVSAIPIYQTSEQVGSVFQNPRTQFFTVDTTSELAFGCENAGLREAEIVERIRIVSEEFQMRELLGKNIFCLSGGEKQKVACASVKVCSPQIIVLDEPSSNLDIAATQELRNMIQVWKREGKTIIIAEHRLSYLNGLLDRIIYLKDGAIVHDVEAGASELTNYREELGLRPFLLSAFSFKKIAGENAQTITLRNFIFSYNRDKKALDIPELELPQQSVIALIGHNGAGKSTFARCLCGLERKCKGALIYEGCVCKSRQRRRLCYMVMQDVNHQLFTESVEEELILSMANGNEDMLDQTLHKMELLDLKNRHPMSLSGGQKQRVAIASALVSERKVMVFDEPTSGLDLKHMNEVASAISELQKMSKTVIVITHDYELIVGCCNYVVHLENGKLHNQYELDDNGVKKLKQFFDVEKNYE